MILNTPTKSKQQAKAAYQKNVNEIIVNRNIQTFTKLCTSFIVTEHHHGMDMSPGKGGLHVVIFTGCNTIMKTIYVAHRISYGDRYFNTKHNNSGFKLGSHFHRMFYAAQDTPNTAMIKKNINSQNL